MKSWFKPLLFVLAAGILFFWNTASMPVWSTDEGRHAEISREMWETKNFVIPQYFHIDYLEKPILSFALTALSIGAFGANAFSARLVSVLCALAGILMMFYFIRRLFSRGTAEFAALMLMVTAGYVLVGRFAVIDMQMTFLLSAAMFCLMTAYFEKKSKYYLLSYVFMGLGFLTKGLIGFVLPGMIFFVFILLRRDFKEILRMQLLPGILILAVIILPWWLLATHQKPEFFQVFIVEHHISRFATKAFGRAKPFWFYVPVLFGACFPWALFLPASITNLFRKEGEHRGKLLFLLCWAAVIFVFFSIPKSKLPYYLLPVSVPVIGLVAAFAQNRTHSLKADAVLRGGWEVLRALGIVALPAGFIALVLPIHDPHFEALKDLFPFGGAVLCAGCLVGYGYFRSQDTIKSIYSLAFMMGAFLLVVNYGMVHITPLESAHAEAQIILDQRKPGDKTAIYASPDDFSDLSFYLKENPLVLGPDRGTLAEPSRKLSPAAQSMVFPDMGDFVKSFNSKRTRYFLLVPAKRFEAVKEQGLTGYRILSQANKKVLLTNA